MWTFANLGIIIVTIAVVIGMKMHLKWGNWLLALLSTITIVIASAFIYSPGYGLGGFLMLTLPFSPVAFVSLWIAYAISGWFGRLKPQQQTRYTRAGD